MRVLSVLGTRPEAIKMAPVIAELARRSEVDSRVCVTAQHRELLDPLLDLFGIHPDWDLNLMKANQTLFDVTLSALSGLRSVLENWRPDIVLVQGDTTTAFVGGLAAFYLRVPVGHVEAGLRTGRKDSPFPEEANRRLVDVLSDLYFAPTERAKGHLLAEGVSERKIHVTGNTVVDALLMTLERAPGANSPIDGIPRIDRRMLLVTGHRRESHGEGLKNICYALRDIVNREPEIEVVYSVHPNPNVRKPVHNILGEHERIHLVEPLDYLPFACLMRQAYVILTDSGGIQEEAPSLSKPVLVMRETTERPELIEAGAGKLVGVSRERIVTETIRLLHSSDEYRKMADAPNPFGDGMAGQRIVDAVLNAAW